MELDEATPDSLVEALRPVRRAQRKRKKERRRAAKLAAAQEKEATIGRAEPAGGQQEADTSVLPQGEVHPEGLSQRQINAVAIEHRSMSRHSSTQGSQVSLDSVDTTESARARLLDEASSNKAAEKVEGGSTRAPKPPARSSRSPRRRGGRR